MGRGALDPHAPPPTLTPPLATTPLRPPATTWPRTHMRHHRPLPNHHLCATPLDPDDPRHTNPLDRRCPNWASRTAAILRLLHVGSAVASPTSCTSEVHLVQQIQFASFLFSIPRLHAIFSGVDVGCRRRCLDSNM